MQQQQEIADANDKTFIYGNACDIVLKKEYIAPNDNKERIARGMNNWHGTKTQQEPMLCTCAISDPPQTCQNQKCKRMHDIDEYLKLKKPELEIPCYEYETYGSCHYKYNCIYKHEGNDGKSYVNPKQQQFKCREKVLNYEQDFFIKLKEIVRGGAPLQPINHTEIIDRPRKELKNKLFLAPMCTVGVLPFRRWCKNFGCDITCSEMVFARDLLQGSNLERAKIRRHPTEDFFGIQITGNKPDDLQRATRLLNDTSNFDYIELNAACPQDIACHKHCGFQIAQDGKIDMCLSNIQAQNTKILSLKTRIGDFKAVDITQRLVNKDIANIDQLDMITLHGRTARQRYSKLADWEKLKQFNELIKEKRPGVVFVGNGDIFNYEDYGHYLVGGYCDSLMIGRGALYKPWIFRELREGHTLDPNSTERTRYYQDFANYLLDHYGSDRMGVEKAREQFLENWVYLCRYVPPYLLEEPQQLNQRLLNYHARDEREQLYASQDPVDWVKVSEIFFGSVPEGFVYQPKHKSKGQIQK